MARLHFEQMEVISIAADGTAAMATLGRDDLLPGRSLLEAAVAIPEQEADPVAVVLIVEQSPSVARLLFAEPVTGAPMQPVAGLDHLLAALAQARQAALAQGEANADPDRPVLQRGRLLRAEVERC